MVGRIVGETHIFIKKKDLGGDVEYDLQIEEKIAKCTAIGKIHLICIKCVVEITLNPLLR